MVQCVAASPATDGWSILRLDPDYDRALGVHLGRTFYFKAYDLRAAPADSAALIDDWAKLGEAAAPSSPSP